jgi:hypothetical protein
MVGFQWTCDECGTGVWLNTPTTFQPRLLKAEDDAG